MSDAPNPTAPGPRPTASAEPPKRWDWRPKLRWFAAEIVIVVAGVLIALAINAWWQGRQDRAQERAYLQQLAADLRETDTLLTEGDARASDPNDAIRALYDAFYAPQRPPRDSLLRLAYRSMWTWPVRPVVGTAEALVTTGDLTLVRNDSLRSAITAYLDDTRRLMIIHDGSMEVFATHANVLDGLIDRATLLEALHPDQAQSLRGSPTWTLTEGERRDPFPFSTEAFLTNREAYTALQGMADANNNLRTIRRLLRTHMDSLHAQVEAELNR